MGRSPVFGKRRPRVFLLCSHHRWGAGSHGLGFRILSKHRILWLRMVVGDGLQVLFHLGKWVTLLGRSGSRGFVLGVFVGIFFSDMLVPCLGLKHRSCGRRSDLNYFMMTYSNWGLWSPFYLSFCHWNKPYVFRHFNSLKANPQTSTNVRPNSSNHNRL